MNGMRFTPGAQVDLLHHARRLWRTVTGDCSLTSIERGILGFTRELDVAGEDIPLVWLAFLRTGVPGILPVVFDHNMMDITSLARMYRVIGDLYRGDVLSTPVDARALGRWLLRHSAADGTAVLEEAFRQGNLDAGAALSLYLKKAGSGTVPWRSGRASLPGPAASLQPWSWPSTWSIGPATRGAPWRSSTWPPRGSCPSAAGGARRSGGGASV